MPRHPAPAAFTAPLVVVEVTRRVVGTGAGRPALSCRRVLLTPGSPLPDRDSRADVVVAAFHPGLTTGEREAITGPSPRAGSSRRFFVVLAVLAVVVLASFAAADAGLVSAWAVFSLLMAALVAFPVYAIVSSSRSISGAWPAWSRGVLAAHRRLFPEDLNDARREVTEPVAAQWGSSEGLRARRCWADLMVVATVPRPVSGVGPAPEANRGTLDGRAVWQTPTQLPCEQLDVEEYAAATRRLVELADGLRAGRVPERSPEHVGAWREVAALARRTGETGRARVDWAPVLHP